jgi:nucleoside-diphosphate-sugar epimerase
MANPAPNAKPLMAPEPQGRAVLVTGATGFVGGHLVNGLFARGYRVRALARAQSDVTGLTQRGIEVVRGDLSDLAALVRATAGQEQVFHTAGRVSDWGSRDQFWTANVEGTAQLIAACQQSGVRRLVHLSSLTVLGLPRDGRLVDEQSPYGQPPPGDFYTESKIGGEQRVRAAHGQGGLETTVVRPGAIWGPGDTVILPRVMRLLRRGLMPYIDQGRNLLGMSYVDNLVLGLCLAAEAPEAAGQLYHVTDGQEITARAALDGLADALGKPRPRVSLPYRLLLGLAGGVEGASRLLRRPGPPPLTRYGVRFVACDCRYDISKARCELGYQPVVGFGEGAARLAALPL